MNQRDLRLDLWRGLALVMIFIDHIPGNLLATVTLKSLGFSDAAELFVFVAGYSAMLAYGKRFFDGQGRAAFLRIMRRCGQLYLSHLALFAGVALLVAGYAFGIAGDGFEDTITMLPFLTDPNGHLAHVLSLRYVPKFLDILPLYVVLMALLPGYLLLTRIHAALCLAASFAVYLVAATTDLEAVIHLGGSGWTFNPFAWQLLFAIGVVTASELRRTGGALPRSLWLIVPAALVVGGGFILAAPWSALPGLESWTLLGPDFIFSFDKPNLSPVRLVHFLSLAYLAAVTVPIAARWLHGRVAGTFIRAGQASLPLFCLGTILSIAGQFAFRQHGQGLEVQLVVNSVGILTILTAASMLASRRESKRRQQEIIRLRADAVVTSWHGQDYERGWGWSVARSGSGVRAALGRFNGGGVRR